MTLPRSAKRWHAWMSAALVVTFGLALEPLTAAAPQVAAEKQAPVAIRQGPPDAEQVAKAVHEAFAGLDIGAVIDEALGALAMALEAADVGRVVEQALADAHVEEHVARAIQQADPARILEEVHRALSEADIDREIDRALDEVRRELRHENIEKVVRDAMKDIDVDKIVRDVLKDVDIDKIVREATELAGEHVKRHQRPPK